MGQRLTIISTCSVLLLTLGCQGRRWLNASQTSVFIMENDRFSIFTGMLVTNRVEGEYGVASYRSCKLFAPVFVWVDLEAVYYQKTLKSQLPTNALLVLKKRKDAQMELLGMDATRAIWTNSAENLQHIKQLICSGKIVSPPETWLSQVEAIALAGSLVEESADSHRYEYRAVRYEFGWRVYASPREGPISFGDEIYIVIGDDGEVKSLSGGL